MSDKPTLRTEAGIPVRTNDHSQTAGPQGPVLLQDFHLLEKLARFNRERIPERIVHAVGSGAYGVFEVTNPDVPKWTRMKLFSQVGKQTRVFARFSTVASSRGGPDTARDPRGFAVKYYTEDGNWDLVGNNTPIFFIRDGIKFPDFIHSQKADPHTNRQEPDNVWDFFAHTPEATHQFMILFSDRGIPAAFANMDGFGSHTFLWVNSAGDRHWVKFHYKTEQGIENLTGDEATVIAGKDPQHHQKALLDGIERGELPSWRLCVQLMPFADAATYRFNPFDVTKVWPHGDYPLIEIGRMVLNETPANYFAEVEQAAFDPGHMVPGIGPSPDKMLQARLFAYGDAGRYRLGTNHIALAVNQPQGVSQPVVNYGRDGFMNVASHRKGDVNYWQNSHDGPQPTEEAYDTSFELSGLTGPHVDARHDEDDDFGQAGALYRLMPEDAKLRLVGNVAGSLAGVSRDDVIAGAIRNFAAADAGLGERLTAAVAARKAG